MRDHPTQTGYRHENVLTGSRPAAGSIVPYLGLHAALIPGSPGRPRPKRWRRCHRQGERATDTQPPTAAAQFIEKTQDPRRPDGRGLSTPRETIVPASASGCPARSASAGGCLVRQCHADGRTAHGLGSGAEGCPTSAPGRLVDSTGTPATAESLPPGTRCSQAHRRCGTGENFVSVRLCRGAHRHPDADSGPRAGIAQENFSSRLPLQRPVAAHLHRRS